MKFLEPGPACTSPELIPEYAAIGAGVRGTQGGSIQEPNPKGPSPDEVLSEAGLEAISKRTVTRALVIPKEDF